MLLPIRGWRRGFSKSGARWDGARARYPPPLRRCLWPPRESGQEHSLRHPLPGAWPCSHCVTAGSRHGLLPLPVPGHAARFPPPAADWLPASHRQAGEPSSAMEASPFLARRPLGAPQGCPFCAANLPLLGLRPADVACEGCRQDTTRVAVGGWRHLLWRALQGRLG
jgi:hypothetical protein